jgi:hypothetical protein
MSKLVNFGQGIRWFLKFRGIRKIKNWGVPSTYQPSQSLFGEQ